MYNINIGNSEETLSFLSCRRGLFNRSRLRRKSLLKHARGPQYRYLPLGLPQVSTSQRFTTTRNCHTMVGLTIDKGGIYFCPLRLLYQTYYLLTTPYRLHMRREKRKNKDELRIGTHNNRHRGHTILCIAERTERESTLSLLSPLHYEARETSFHARASREDRTLTI